MQEPSEIENQNAFFNAVRNDDIDNVRHFIEVMGVPASIQNGQALIEAAGRGHMDIVSYLISDVRVSADRQTGFFYLLACVIRLMDRALLQESHIGWIYLLRVFLRFIESAIFLDLCVPADIQNGQALINAAKNGHLNIVHNIFMATGSKISSIRHGNALVEASDGGHLDVVRYMIEGAGVSADFCDGLALIRAAKNGHLNVICFLIVEKGIRADIRNGDALIMASQYGHLNVVRYFVKEARVPAHINNGEALILASQFGHLEIVRYLVHEAPVALRVRADIRNGEALILASKLCHLEIVRYLVQEAPEALRVRTDIRHGEALILASTFGHLEIVRYLVHEAREAFRIPIGIQNGQALIAAVQNRQLEIIRYLGQESPAGLDNFAYKIKFFKQQLRTNNPRSARTRALNITVRRAHVFEDSFATIKKISGEEFKKARLSIKFADEEGVDAGGLTREWYSVLVQQIFNPSFALFQTSAADQLAYQPNRLSRINPDNLLYYHFIGRFIGKAVFDSVNLDCHFTRSFYKQILSLPVEIKDMEDFDPILYRNLRWIVENDITEANGFDDFTFTTDVVEFGTVKSVELKENGASIPVTAVNKKEYVQLLTEFKLITSIKPQIDAFLSGFNEIITPPLISVFNAQELELLISGMPEIDLDDWRCNCEYHGGYTIASPQIKWFWQAVHSFDSEMQAKLLHFVTGSSKVPLEGFFMLQGSNGIHKFQIHRVRPSELLPTAHTCFNHLNLPEYETYELLRHKLVLALKEGGTGFGFI